jgi:hypothetical protein
MPHDPGKTGDLIVHLDEARAHELGQGTTIRLLRYSEETGDWVLWVNMQPGATFAPHWHLGHGQYFVTKGELLYDVGSAPAGTYGYEPITSRHSEARCEVETEYLFLGHGAVAFTDDAGQVRFILNHEFLRDLAKGDLVADVSNEAADDARERLAA